MPWKQSEAEARGESARRIKSRRREMEGSMSNCDLHSTIPWFDTGRYDGGDPARGDP